MSDKEINEQANLFTDNENLLPCIECGGNAKIGPSLFGDMYSVKCTQCGARSKYSYRDNGKAIVMWNMNNHPNRG